MTLILYNWKPHFYADKIMELEGIWEESTKEGTCIYEKRRGTEKIGSNLAFSIMIVNKYTSHQGYLVGPRSFGLHFYALEVFCSDHCVECGTSRK
jgi:hypothetical protein